MTVNANPNTPPTANGDQAATNEGTAVIIAVLANDTDGDGDPLTVSAVTRGAHGAVTINGDGTVTYTPDANFYGSDSFTYKANDGLLDSNTTTVVVTVKAVNDAPTATADVYSVNENETLIIGAPGVLDNDSDVDSAGLTALLVSGPSHGILTLNPDGSFSYTPAAEYSGPDGFAYKVNDGLDDSNTTTVVFTVTAKLRIEEIQVNDGVGKQRSNIESLRVRFNQDTNLQTLIDNGNILQAIRLVGLAELTLQASRFRYDAPSRTLTIDLTGDGWGSGRGTILADGRYRLRLDTRLISAAGRPDLHLIDRDGVDDLFGSYDFHRLMGDFDGDADVDLSDRDLLFQRYGALANSALYDFAFDLTNDGRIDQSDYVLWKRQYSKRL